MDKKQTEAYLKRIGFQGEPSRTEETLGRLIRDHLEHVPFENLDVRDFGKTPRIDPESLYEKIVANRRGGYCFEMNTMFRELLEALGFSVYPVAARVMREGGEIPPFMHMMLICQVEGQDYLCDVGFGGPGPKGLVRFDETEQTVAGETFRLVRERDMQGEMRLDRKHHGAWVPTLQVADRLFRQQDFMALNYFCGAHPESMFRKVRIANLCTATGSKALADMELTIRDGDTVTKQVFGDKAQLEQVLEREFGLRVSLPEGKEGK